jgi:hypothetical protein
MKQQLFIDCCDGSGFHMELNESSLKGGLAKFRGKFQEAEAINKNKRMYPYSVLDENVKKLAEAISDRRLIGELDHPTDSIVHFANASHVITKLWWENNTLMGEGEILSTPSGRILHALINDGVKIGISSRGVGQGTTNEDGILVIGEGYKLITFDAVADPSTYAAFQERIGNTGRRSDESTIERKSLISNNFSTKNESCGIDTVSKEALVACLGQIIKTRVEQV